MASSRKRPLEEITKLDQAKLVAEITEELLKRQKKIQQPIKDEEDDDKYGNEKTVNPQTLIDQFNHILADIIHEDGFRLVKNEYRLFHFEGKCEYPNNMSIELQNKIKNVSGVVRIDYRFIASRTMLITILFTRELKMQIKYSHEDHEESTNHRDIPYTPPSTIPKEAQFVLKSFHSFLDMELEFKTENQRRSISDEIAVIIIRCGIKSPTKDHQLFKVFVDQAGKIISLTWGAHESYQTLFLTSEIYSDPIKKTLKNYEEEDEEEQEVEVVSKNIKPKN